MAALTHAQEYSAVREAIQLLTTLDADGNRRDAVSVSVDGMSTTYASSQLQYLQQREVELANRICNRNRRKRVIPGFDYV